MSDLIRREDVVEALYQAIRTTLTGTFTDSMSLAIAMANNLPAAESERIVKVETYTDDQQETWSVCECGTDVWKSYNYCPECGCRLEWV